jgi:hypothetical protein
MSMRIRPSHEAMVFLATGAFALLGCAKEPTTTTTKTTTETKQAGSTSESTTKTTTETPHGDSTATTNSYVGTVTEFTAGKSIQVMTGDQDKHSFDLDDKDVVAAIDSRVAVGSKVRLVEDKGDSGSRRITVTIAPAA